MTAPNRNALWARAFVDELAEGGVSAVCITPGSRSTPLTEAFDRHEDVHVFSHLDERSSAYFALGRARRTGDVTPLVCTSGTAAANFHPAVIEAYQSRVPLLLLTADRPPELRDSGANQTIDQEKLYGDAVRWYKDLPEPEAEPRKLRSLRTTAARALSEATGTPSGPVHLNVPFRKPLEPTPVEGDVPDDLPELAASGRDGAFVKTTPGVPELGDDELRSLAERISEPRGLVVAGPADAPGVDGEAVAAFAHASGFPVLADPLSGVRFGGHVRVTPTLGGYDSYLDPRVTAEWPDPDVVLRFGASPTSKTLRNYLARTDAEQLVIDPAGEWREAEFTATDLVVADPSRLLTRLSRLLAGPGSAEWRRRFEAAEAAHWEAFDASADAADAETAVPPEGRVLADVAELAPQPSTLFVSNSMPVRDADRFARPTTKARTVLGNRGASGIDGIVSTALGAGSATTDELTLVTGDIAYYHDMNGLLALARCDADATVVLINNDGGGIFHMLPIEEYDPPFTSQFKTPHGLDFEPTADLYDLSYARVAGDDREGFREAYAEATAAEGSHVVEVVTDAEESHRARERLHERVVERLAEDG
ncbi:2-succinyl-5-enolpyruvyl-6-hydroxy-3-cyclohexene-1-carboxylic-acid synthase [Halopelagius longus]|uniref:2-succinyl-5-enolpyruvyl-6-hydroxy-3-cyclohexene-1-carboxylate synthase n=1 Tax=Halopelagius longus TaxID=1236180 RepID=A0A1H1ASK2_9EURY|nr:2-succinyl-5-enolpyruvyl-6-hydroxy-3-cyclohexene-1-carboxylic-acid synthase [Halopelagius longus]RDI70502.1 2-succinyl-5-enolpyruvyl-6-hydroxy-3-cyclohexene-1-carboxylic-acid synthase [Halopelagius longus]SDQ42663.1 2-succinyl-5-enolpyruvyl-6-hydroxy-3-cyclohexene-1-carboxylate synthase [Halopelagius longus]